MSRTPDYDGWETLRDHIEAEAVPILANAMQLALRLRMPLLGDKDAEAITIEKMAQAELHIILDQVSLLQLSAKDSFDEYRRRFYARCNEIANAKG